MPDRMLREPVECPPDQVTECVTAEHVAAQEYDIDTQYDTSQAYAEAIRKEERLHCVVRQNAPHQIGQAQKVAVKVLHYQRKPAFSQVRLARLADSACRRVSPERFVISAAVVIAGQAEKTWYPKNQQRR